jgi:hypothetical protein
VGNVLHEELVACQGVCFVELVGRSVSQSFGWFVHWMFIISCSQSYKYKEIGSLKFDVTGCRVWNVMQC